MTGARFAPALHPLPRNDAMPAPPADPIASDGPSPLDILLAVMRAKWAEGDADGAAELARAAAPYLHPRRAPVAAERAAGRAKEAAPALSDAELEREIAALAHRSGAAPIGADLFAGLGVAGALARTSSPGGASSADHR